MLDEAVAYVKFLQKQIEVLFFEWLLYACNFNFALEFSHTVC